MQALAWVAGKTAYLAGLTPPPRGARWAPAGRLRSFRYRLLCAGPWVVMEDTHEQRLSERLKEVLAD